MFRITTNYNFYLKIISTEYQTIWYKKKSHNHKTEKDLNTLKYFNREYSRHMLQNAGQFLWAQSLYVPVQAECP